MTDYETIKKAFDKRFPQEPGDAPVSPFHFFIFEEGYKAAIEAVKERILDKKTLD